ncbi:Cys-tRNA(Pro)/Cys-tRNA(Cys) deacylase YbaK [compost metagenome]
MRGCCSPATRSSLSQGNPPAARYDSPMTPAINLLKREKIAHTVHSYVHDAHAESYGGEAVEKLGLDPAQVFKTLLASTETHELLVAIVPVAGQLDLKALAEAAGCKKCEMAAVDAAQRATGYLVGGISPLGQKKRLRSFLDASARSLPQLHVSAGRRGLEVELAPTDLLRLTAGHYAAIGRPR